MENPYGTDGPTPQPQSRTHPVRSGLFLVLTLAAIVAAFVITYLVFVTTRGGQYVDERALAGALRFSRAEHTPQILTTAFDLMPSAVGIACAVGVGICMIVRRTVLGPLVASAGGLVAIIMAQVLKHGVLPRPDLGISDAQVVSFPSGHTTVAAAGVMALLLSLGPTLRPTWGAIGSLVAGAAGMSTVALGWHRPSDVVGALLLVGTLGLLAASVVSLLEARQDRRAAATANELQAQMFSPFGPGVQRPAGTGACVSMAVIGLAATVTATLMMHPFQEVPAGPRLRWDTDWTGAQDPTMALAWGLVAVLGVALAVFPLLGLWASRWGRPSSRA